MNREKNEENFDEFVANFWEEALNLQELFKKTLNILEGQDK